MRENFCTRSYQCCCFVNNLLTYSSWFVCELTVTFHLSPKPNQSSLNDVNSKACSVMSRLITEKDVQPSELSCHVLAPSYLLHYLTLYTRYHYPSPHASSTSHSPLFRYSHHEDAVACMDVSAVNTSKGTPVASLLKSESSIQATAAVQASCSSYFFPHPPPLPQAGASYSFLLVVTSHVLTICVCSLKMCFGRVIRPHGEVHRCYHR